MKKMSKPKKEPGMGPHYYSPELTSAEQNAVQLIRSYARVTCSLLGSQMYNTGRFPKKPQAYARIGGKLIQGLVRKGVVRRCGLGPLTEYELHPSFERSGSEKATQNNG